MSWWSRPPHWWRARSQARVGSPAARLVVELTGRPGGIYRLEDSLLTGEFTVTDLAQAVAAAGRHALVVDGGEVSDKASFIAAVGHAGAFPGWSGQNWDALQDSLSDLSWSRAGGYVVLFSDPARFARASPQDWSVAADVFSSVAGWWSDRDVGFHVLLLDDDPRLFTAFTPIS